jgi:hypothetical protein
MLIKANVGGNFLNIIQSMYGQVFYCIKLDNGITPAFQSKVGVILFNLYLSDLPQIYLMICVLLLYISLMWLLAALILMSETDGGLKNCLKKLWKVIVTNGNSP